MSDDLTKLSGPELADWLDTLAAGYDRLSSMPGRTSAEGDRLRESARRLREDTREWQRNLERERDGLRAELADVKAELHKWRNGHQLQAFQEDLNEMHARAMDAEKERDGLRERVRELEEEVTGSDCDDAHEWLEMLYQGSESRGNPHGFAWTIKNELQFASMEIGNLKADRDEWRTQHENLLAMYRASEETCANQRKELHSLNVERKATLTKLEDAQRRIAELEAQLSEPAERKAQEERAPKWRWTVAQTIDALDSCAEVDGAHSLAGMAASHLRETLAKLDAVRALAEEWERLLNGAEHGPAWAPIVRLREVLDGKR